MENMDENENLGYLNIDTTLYKTRISPKFLKRKQFIPSDPGLIQSFIPGTVLEILVKPGQKVKKGENLIILDAMKMQNMMKSGIDGTIKSIAVKEGDKVSKGKLLLEIG
jgi:biotin carboxyl carrier protein